MRKYLLINDTEDERTARFVEMPHNFSITVKALSDGIGITIVNNDEKEVYNLKVRCGKKYIPVLHHMIQTGDVKLEEKHILLSLEYAFLKMIRYDTDVVLMLDTELMKYENEFRHSLHLYRNDVMGNKQRNELPRTDSIS